MLAPGKSGWLKSFRAALGCALLLPSDSVSLLLGRRDGRAIVGEVTPSHLLVDDMPSQRW